MPIIDEHISIPRSPEDVFDYVSKSENVPIWDSSIIRAEQIGDEPVTVGTRFRGSSKILGRNMTDRGAGTHRAGQSGNTG